MELSVAEASSSKAVQKKPSPARRTGKEKVTEEVNNLTSHLKNMLSVQEELNFFVSVYLDCL